MPLEIPIDQLRELQNAPDANQLPSDEEYLMQQMLEQQLSAQPTSRNYTAGNPVKDWETQNYRNTDPSAGSGDGAICEPQKIETY